MLTYGDGVGDNSDNIKGVDGIGPKGASELLSEYKTLDGIYDHLAELSENHRTKLIADQDAAYFARSLATIVDAPCDWKKEDTALDKLDYRGLQKFFEEMEMRSLQRRLTKMIPADKLASEDQMAMF